MGLVEDGGLVGESEDLLHDEEGTLAEQRVQNRVEHSAVGRLGVFV